MAHLEPLRAARHGGEDVVGIHRAEDEVSAGPRLQAASAEHGVSRPRLQASHAHGCQVVHLSLVLHLNTAFVVLPGRKEESAIDQGVSVNEEGIYISFLFWFNRFTY